MSGRRGSSVGTRYNVRSAGEQNRCQVGPTILFECPAQIPRSFLRSFSLWAPPPAAPRAALFKIFLKKNFSPGPAGRMVVIGNKSREKQAIDRRSRRRNSSHTVN